MSYETVLYTVDGSVATIRFNRPDKLNAFNDQMIKETTHALKAAGRDTAVRAIVLTGHGRGFSAGQDLMEAAALAGQANQSLGDHLRHTYHILINQMLDMDKPIIGVVNGIAAGIGMSIALMTDLRLMSDQAVFTLGFSKIGLVPDGGVNWLLTRMIGYPRAYELAVSSAKVTAVQAYDWGMVNQIVPHDQLAEVATAYAQQIAAGPTLTFGLTKRVMLRGMDQTLAENLEYEAHLQTIAGRSEDCREGVFAFVEKRPAKFQGK
jgi:2-(1,2-epoxy-1,2-dihydrophenyl)acetyl-CoA isomerase